MLKKVNAHPIKKFGQNFLTSEPIIERILQAAGIGPEDTVVEIGPGYGALTFLLAKRATRVYAIEKDRDLAAHLRQAINERRISNLHIIEADIRDISVSEILQKNKPYKLIGNIPYYITGFLFRKFLEAEKQKPEIIIFMTQQEVAERIVSHEPKHSLLSVSVQAYGTPAIIERVPRSFFSPSPKVDSVVISVSHISSALFNKAGVSEKRFFDILRAGFSHPRKLLVSNLSRTLKIPRENVLQAFRASDIKEKARASELSVEQWFRIARIMNQES